MNPFQHSNYVVLDMPPPVASQVHAIRARYDAKMASLPVEVTITGSSGIGTLHHDQNPVDVFKMLDDVAAVYPPIQTRFDGIHCFPGTEWYYLSMYGGQFLELQERIAATEIKFNEIQYKEFTPHCSLANLAHAGVDLRREIVDEEYSREPFALKTLSVYELDPAWNCQLLFQTTLGGEGR